ncbi:MAG: hypothetical protein IJV50_09280 [Lachnospiraceae bacterium]|nr:hypothetical protein [Lachnospiraceae bacterium]
MREHKEKHVQAGEGRIIKTAQDRFSWKRFGIIAFFLGWCKHALAVSLPLYALTTAGFDDRLMVNLTYWMMNGEWLGTYNSNTFVKGIGFPVFLAGARMFGFSYLSAISLFYIIACILIVIAMRPVLQKTWQGILVYGVLLFNPETISYTTQRVYRNSLTPSQVLLILACCFAIYLRYRQPVRKWWGWAVGAALSVAFFWHTREDALWLAPFLVVFAVVLTVGIFGSAKSWKEKLGKSISVIAPILVIPLSTAMISAVNYHHYGMYISNELGQGNFPKALQAMYTAQTDTPEIEYVSVSQAKLEQLYTYSPSLAEIRDELAGWSQLFATYDRNPEDGEVEDGYFFWVLRMAAEEKGYYESPQKADAYFGRIASELQTAFDNGTLGHTWSMPSALMPPWRKGNFGRLMQALAESMKTAVCFEDGGAVKLNNGAEAFSDGADGVTLFEAVTNNIAIDPAEVGKEYKVRYEQKFWGVLEIIHNSYRLLSPLAFAVAVMGYLFGLVQTIRGMLHSEHNELQRRKWLILTGLGCNILALCCGISYNHISCCPTIVPFYLSGVYPMILLFEVLGILWGSKELYQLFQRN